MYVVLNYTLMSLIIIGSPIYKNHMTMSIKSSVFTSPTITMLSSKFYRAMHRFTNRTSKMPSEKTFRTTNINKILCLFFTDVFDSAVVQPIRFNVQGLDLSLLPAFGEKSDSSSSVGFFETVRKKASRWREGSNITLVFGAAEHACHRELGTGQMRQAIQSAAP